MEPLLRSDPEGELSATTILEWLDERYPGRFGNSQLRTLQRRIRDYRALHGPDRGVYFQQDHPPGREAQVDFTHCSGLGVTIGGEPFRHLLFHLVLSHSGWSYAEVCFGETFATLVKGLQGAPWELGGVPSVIRTDNLSAATHELRDSRGRAMNASYEAVLAHYGVEPTRTNPRSSHENGVVEQRHRQYALYSVPSATCPPGQKVEVRLGSKLVRIYHRGRLIKVHPRQGRGGRSTDPDDYPSELSA